MTKYNIHALLTEGAHRFQGHPYIFERQGDAFSGKSFDRFAQDVWAFAATLLTRGLCGSKVILYGGNSYDYMVADLALMGYVGVSCTVSREWSAQDLMNAVTFLETDAIIYSRQKEETVRVLKEQCPQLHYIELEAMQRMIAERLSQQPMPRSTDTCCKIIFSSGTTGMPKAVMLAQDNMFAAWDSLYRRTPFTPEDRDYLFLPLSHTYSGICNFLYSLITGMQIYLCSSTRRLMEELQMVRPTVFCAVPLIYEKLYEVCMAGGISPVDALGGHIRYLFSGGAVLKREIRVFLKNAGINLLEAYGLTETSSLVSCEYTDPTDFDSVGTVMECVEVRIDRPDAQGIGEVMVRGENLFSGYYGNASATIKAFDVNGFFRTGDLGYVNGNKLYLVGRKRRMILLSNGENVFCDEIEALFAVYPQISHAKVYERNDRVFASLYAVSDCDGESIVGAVNEMLPTYARVQAYEVIADSIDKRLK